MNSQDITTKAKMEPQDIDPSSFRINKLAHYDNWLVMDAFEDVHQRLLKIEKQLGIMDNG